MVASRRPAEDGDQRQKRHDRQILQQQHREGTLAVARVDVAVLLEDLHRKGGRGQRQPEAGDDAAAASRR